MFRKYFNFIRGISVNWVGVAGVVLTTTAFVGFIFFELLRLAGVVTNAYVGLITYLLFPSMFIMGLILTPFAWMIYKKKRQMSTRELLEERFEPAALRTGFLGTHVFLIILFMTGINVLFITGVGFRTLKFMDEPRFCGTACHNVMGPEWAAYQQSPHSRVKCVECHVGQGVDAVVNAKLNGIRQMVLATLSDYDRPIPTPVHQLRPSRETCEQCHWPEKFYGNRLKTIVHFGMDKDNTPRYTTLQLKIDTGQTSSKSGIHWHIAAENEIRYASVGDRREKILWVDVKQSDGTFKRYRNISLQLNGKKTDTNIGRTMDCVDCHNRVTHVYEDPESAVDERLAKGLVDKNLPFIKREILAAVTKDYPSDRAGLTGIRNHLTGFYRSYDAVFGATHTDDIEQAIQVAQDIYRRNIHHHMRIDWDTYPNHLGHKDGAGCFRCHNPDMRDSQGHQIRSECTLCHSILAYDNLDRFQYLSIPSKKRADYKMHRYLRGEFMSVDTSAKSTNHR